MKKRFSKTLCIMLIFLLLFSSMPGVQSFAAESYDGSASSWAVSEIEDAEKNGLTYPGILSKFKQDINREEFCMIVVKLYEALSGEKAQATGDPFTDTKNPEIIKAYNLGIVQGTGGGKFTPNKNITRQELATMIYRTLDKALPGLPKALINNYTITDKNKISSWALESVEYCFDREIIKGIGGGIVDPFSNTTREQAIAIINRTYLSHMDPAELEELLAIQEEEFKKNPGATVNETEPKLTEKQKVDQLDWKNRMAYPVFDSKVSIDTVKSPGLAAKKATPYGNFIDPSGDKKIEFAFKNQAVGAKKVVWQVSGVQFNGLATNWKSPGGLLAQGEVSATAGKFTVDFGTKAIHQSLYGLKDEMGVYETGQMLASILPIIPILPIDPIIPSKPGIPDIFLQGNQVHYQKALGIGKKQSTYYVRAVPIDASGKPIGDPGLGLPVVYGQPLMPVPVKTNIPKFVKADFELWTTVRGTEPSKSGEFPNYFKLQEASISVDPQSNSYVRWFQWNKVDSQAYKIVLQVATEKFSYNKDNWETAKGLVYQKEYILAGYSSTPYPNSAPINLKDFAPSSAELGNNAIDYYVRAVAVKMDKDKAGAASVTLSQPVKMAYHKTISTIKWYTPKTITVPSNALTIKSINYTPIQFEEANWEEYYEVFRAPKWNEITFKVKNEATGEILHPYSQIAYKNITPNEYEQKIIPKFLKEGTELHIKPPEPEKKGYWGELWDTIYDFFKQAIDLVTKLVNWVSETYERMKVGLVNFVANLVPIEPLKSMVAMAMTYLVEAGLAALGLPPSLPNFDDLLGSGLAIVSDSMAYSVMVSLQEEAVAVLDLVPEEVKALTETAYDQAKQASKKSTPNPVDAPFLKASSKRIYQPAYVDIVVKNSSKYNISPAGSIHIRMMSGNYPSFPMFEPVNQPIPALLPGEEIPIRLFLKETVAAGETYTVTLQGQMVHVTDYYNAYFGQGNFKDIAGNPASYKKANLEVSIFYDLPVSAETEAKRLGLDKIPNKEDYLLTYEYDVESHRWQVDLIPKDKTKVK